MNSEIWMTMIIWKSNNQFHHSKKNMFCTRYIPEDLMKISQEFRMYVIGTSVNFAFYSIVKQSRN